MNLFEFKGIGTQWWIKIFDDLPSTDLKDLEVKIINIVKEFEESYSRFKDTSLVSKLNREKHIENPPEDLIKMIQIGLETFKVTDGHFNIGVGKLLEDLGYDKKYSFVNSSQNKDKYESEVILEENKITIGSETRIDLGGIGKGFLIDKVKAFLDLQKIKFYTINAGGDIYATSNKGTPLDFALENPFNLKEMIGTISIKDQSIASSSPSRRNWKDSKDPSKRLHHLIDMKNKKSKMEIAAVFTQGQTATDTDVASTSLFVSPSNLYNQIAEFFKVEYLIVFSDGTFVRSTGYQGILNT